ncbi:histidine phosphatase family protein [Catelliglobosispora koreensis]|uniref:histidine phosphatase family protein n=1 Tax=Catelliglobosispora koreensis TaxID=129052 RepID=UPI000363F76A|nr:histidine phosphatase family protein [Catelliglobosispora koreensis]
MTISYLMRHGRTDASARYIASSDPAKPILLDAAGIAQCQQKARSGWVSAIASTITSEFPRAQQTAGLLLGEHPTDIVVEPLLNEINYGVFDGGPWMAYGDWLGASGPHAAPEGGEARSTAIGRYLQGLSRCLDLPGPRLIVGHGLMISALMQLMVDRPLLALDLPEAPYVTAIPLSDGRLCELIDGGQRALSLIR